MSAKEPATGSPFVLFEVRRCPIHNAPLCRATQHGGRADGSSIEWCLTTAALEALANVIVQCREAEG